MGNGAVISTDTRNLTRKEFEVVERLCRNYHFHDNFNDYKTSVLKAIDNDAIDMLEILIPAGNAKKLQPLHIACRLAKLESAELLLSAGFSCLLQDADGRTPLHLCSISRSLGAGLCATLLSLSNKNALTIRDSTGLTPLHLAAAQNNLHVIEALMNNGADVTITSSTGKTPYQVAMDNKNFEALDLLKQMVGNKRTNNKQTLTYTSSSSSNTGKKSTKQQSKVEYDRIMQVWEKFFENAFKRLGIDPDELDDETEQYTSADDKAPSSSTNSIYSHGNSGDSQRNEQKKGKRKGTAYNEHYSSPKYYDNWTCDEKHDSGRDEYNHQQSEYFFNDSYQRNQYVGSSVKKKRSAKYKYDNEYQFEQQKQQQYAYNYDQFEVSDFSSKTVESSSKAYSSEYPYSCTDNESYKGDLPPADDYVKTFEWFQWVVCYSEETAAALALQDQQSEEEAYYVLNKDTGESVWLLEFIDRFLHSTLLPCEDWSDFELHMRLPLPTTLREVLTRGWLTYYDRTENSCICQWINLPTKSVEAHLPLGIGEAAADLALLNLVQCEGGGDTDNTLWYAADQTCASAWVLVVGSATPEDETDTDTNSGNSPSSSGAVYYYRNRVTGETCWDPPPNWDKLLSSWEYWTLCCNEDSCDDLYWFDFDTGESAWVEKHQ